MTRVGFVGLGSQGGPMAGRIVDAGFSLTLWARRPEALEPYLAQGARAADGLAELAAASDHVGVCVVDDTGVAQVCDVLLPAMAAGSLLAVHSTILPQSCVALAERCAERGIDFLDAPVSGGGPAAAAGRLSVMCGGTAQAFARARPVFDSFAGLCLHLGPAGSGQKAKLVNNALMAAHMGLAQAALACAEALGVERAALVELVKASSGRSFGFETYARLPSPTAFAHGAALLAKDVRLLGEAVQGGVGSKAAGELAAAAGPFLAAASG